MTVFLQFHMLPTVWSCTTTIGLLEFYIRVRVKVTFTVTYGKKKIIVVLPSSGISEKVGSVGRKIFFFLIIFFKKHPKGSNLGAYSIIFLKKHPIWAKLGAFPNLLFLFLFLNRVGRWGRHNIFFFWPNSGSPIERSVAHGTLISSPRYASAWKQRKRR